MGMSASQARLLSITSRLTNNEFRAQTITNSKLRLATESETASQKYMDALDSKQLMFMTYGDDGSSSKVSLTPAVLFDYASMKNQYSLTNAAGKILVSSQDAKNFENSDNLEEFLGKYNLIDNNTNAYRQYIEKLKKYEEDMADYDKLNREYEINHDNWVKAKNDYDEKYNNWEIEYEKYQEEYDKELIKYENEVSNSLAEQFANLIGTSGNPQQPCYQKALNGDTGCYIHLLTAILTKGYKSVSGYLTADEIPTGLLTTTGDPVSIPENPSLGYIGSTSDTTDEQRELFDAVYDALNETGSATRYVDGTDTYNPNNPVVNTLKDTYDCDMIPTKFEELRSDFYVEKDDDGNPKRDEDGNIIYNKKTLKQKAVDLYYIIYQCQNNGNKFPDYNEDVVVNLEDMKAMLINFTEGDLRNLSEEPEFNPPLYDGPEHPGAEPIEPKNTAVKPEEPVCSLKIIDKEKGQWYVNLWYKMNGGETADLVRKVDDQNAGYIEFNIDNMSNMLKSKNKTNYAVLEDNLLKSSEWLEFALEHGVVSFEKATYYNPAETDIRYATIKKDAISWVAMPYSNATDIISVDDEKAIAIAEVTYKKTITEIENQDKKFDQDLKKLDTEHNALQTEYESIKEVISKNTERSFKAFS